MKKKAVLCLRTAIVNDLGMHARPAAKIAEMAMAAKGNIWLSNGSLKVDASSIIDILTLSAVKGTDIEIEAQDMDDEQTIQDIKTFFDIGFGEMDDE